MLWLADQGWEGGGGSAAGGAGMSPVMIGGVETVGRWWGSTVQVFGRD